MPNDKSRDSSGRGTAKFLGSLREALAAAGREDPTRGRAAADVRPAAATAKSPALAGQVDGDGGAATFAGKEGKGQSAAEAAKEARGGAPNVPPVDLPVDGDSPPTTRVVRGARAWSEGQAPEQTQLLRGKQQVKRGKFHQDPVVGWLVIVGGPGLGCFRPICEGNNSIGRSRTQRVPIDFGDDTISSEEQAFIRYDSADRTFLFVPNLAKTNVVAVNDKRPTMAVPLQAMDVITMGRTQMVFVPFCGPDFDWSELSET